MKVAGVFAELAFASTMLMLPAMADAQDVLRGQALAERWGANCHVVSRAATTGRSDGLPTFPALAARKETTPAMLKGAMTATHSRMPDFHLGGRAQDDLVAYILSLRPQ